MWFGQVIMGFQIAVVVQRQVMKKKLNRERIIIHMLYTFFFFCALLLYISRSYTDENKTCDDELLLKHLLIAACIYFADMSSLIPKLFECRGI